jgi:hypothetical protein
MTQHSREYPPRLASPREPVSAYRNERLRAAAPPTGRAALDRTAPAPLMDRVSPVARTPADRDQPDMTRGNAGNEVSRARLFSRPALTHVGPRPRQDGRAARPLSRRDRAL